MPQLPMFGEALSYGHTQTDCVFTVKRPDVFYFKNVNIWPLNSVVLESVKHDQSLSETVFVLALQRSC